MRQRAVVQSRVKEENMNVEISDDLWKRIEYFAAMFKKTPMEYLMGLLQQQVPRIPDKDAAIQHLQDLIDGKYADPGLDDDDLAEFLRTLEQSRLKFPARGSGEMDGAKV
jgi:hypothetical protein